MLEAHFFHTKCKSLKIILNQKVKKIMFNFKFVYLQYLKGVSDNIFFQLGLNAILQN